MTSLDQRMGFVNFTKNTNEIAPVALAPLSDAYYDDVGLEPPLVRVRAANNSYVCVSSRDINGVKQSVVGRDFMPLEAQKPNDCVVGMPGNGQLTRRLRRIGVAYCSFYNQTPTINESNNLLRVFRGDTNTIVECRIAQGFFDHPQAMMTNLVASLNSSLTGLTFTAVAPTPSQSQLIWGLVCTQPFNILWDSPAVTYGTSTFNFQVTSGPTFTGGSLSGDDIAFYRSRMYTQAPVGPIYCVPTRYVDFVSNNIQQWNKNPSTSTSFGSNGLLFRLMLTRFGGYLSNPGNFSTPIYQPLEKHNSSWSDYTKMFNVNPTENISTIDVKILDEYGRVFYIPPAGPFISNNNISDNILNATGGCEWDLIFATET